MSNRLKVQGTQQHLRRLLERCKEAGIPDATISTMCFTDRSQIRRWREGEVTPRNFDQVLLVALALVGTLGETAEPDSLEVQKIEKNLPADDDYMDPSLLEPWEDFIKRRHNKGI